MARPFSASSSARPSRAGKSSRKARTAVAGRAGVAGAQLKLGVNEKLATLGWSSFALIGRESLFLPGGFEFQVGGMDAAEHFHDHKGFFLLRHVVHQGFE